MFNGDWNLVLAAYNGGPGRVQRAMKRSGKDDFWELVADAASTCPRDARVRAADPGGDHRRQEPGAVRLRHHRARADLRTTRSPCRAPSTSAAWPSGPARHRRDPGAQSGAAPLDDAGEVRDIRDEGAGRHRAKFEARLAEASPADMTALKWYTVKGGESLATIARKLQGEPRRTWPKPTTCGHGACPDRAGTDHPARAGDAAGRTPRAAAPAEVASRPVTGPATVAAAPARSPDSNRLPRQARRHAVVDRAAVRYHDHPDQVDQPAPRQCGRRRHQPENRALTDSGRGYALPAAVHRDDPEPTRTRQDLRPRTDTEKHRPLA